MTSAANKYPAFFKYFLPEHCSERLVEAREIDGKIYFDDGWKQLVEENCLDEVNFIVFEYDGRKRFKFKVYEVDGGCQKIGEKDDRMEEEEEEEETDVDSDEEFKREHVGRHHLRACKAPVVRKSSNRFKFKVYEVDGCQKKGERDEGAAAIENDYRIEEEEESEEEEEEEEMDGDFDDEFKGEHAGRHNLRACKAPVVGKRGTAGRSANNNSGIDAVKYVHSDDPYFIAKLSKGRSNELHIPKNVIDDFSLYLPQTITLLCCQHNGRNEIHDRRTRGMCTGKVDEWKDGRVYIKQWADFCKRNRINIQNDACIYEFVLGEDQEIHMLQVHVVKNGRNVS